jgi:hypothetical protein
MRQSVAGPNGTGNTIPEQRAVANALTTTQSLGRGKLSKRETNYRLATPGAMRRCGNCSMFLRRTQACTLVAGIIRAPYVCDEWEARR